MAKDIDTYVRTCISCQRNKPDRRITRPPLTPLVAPDGCWLTVGVDLIPDLPKSGQREFNAICVFVCHLSKMCRLIPCKTTLNTRGFARLYIREVFPHYGMPGAIVADRGPQWCSIFFKALCEEIGIDLRYTSSYHPSTNGLVERTNEVIEAAIRHYVSADFKDWHESVPFVEFALNNSYHETIKCTPFAMNRVNVPQNPFDTLVVRAIKNSVDKSGDSPQLLSTMTRWLGTSKLHTGTRTAVQAKVNFAAARQCVDYAKTKMKLYHDGKGTNVTRYEVGDLVWMHIRNLSLRHPSHRGKLLPRYIGPLKVISVPNKNAVKIDLPSNLQIHNVVSASLLKPYIPRDNSTQEPQLVGNELEWEVEAITNHNLSSRKRGGSVLEFCVQWKGEYPDSWHEFPDFTSCLDTLEKYLFSCTSGLRIKLLKALLPSQVQMLSDKLKACLD